MRAIVNRASSNVEVAADWGGLTWFANAAIGNSDAMTVGRCVIRPGKVNPRHLHPNCSEVLVVGSGRVAHTLDGQSEVELGPGDSVTIPQGMAHCARNIGAEDAVLWICFSSAHREFVPVEQPPAPSADR